MSDQVKSTSVDPLFDELKSVIANGNAVFIVGTGVSVASTLGQVSKEYFTWPQLLHNALDKCLSLRLLSKERADIIRSEINLCHLDDLLSAAEKIERMLGAPSGGDFNGWLYDYFNNIKISSQEIPHILKETKLPIITTNYDNIIEQCTQLNPYTWKDPPNVLRILKREKEGVIHLHGYFEQPQTVVLGIRSYDRLLSDPSANGLREAIATLKSMIFVGMGQGLEDPNFSALLGYMSQAFSNSPYKHYYLCRNCDIEGKDKQEIIVKNEDGTDKKETMPPIEPFNKRFPNAQAQRLYPVSYGENFSDLAPFLRRLQSNFQ
jgi:hypothetical protein